MYGEDVRLDLLPSNRSIVKVSGPTMDELCQPGFVDQFPEAPSANIPLVVSPLLNVLLTSHSSSGLT